MIEEMQSSPRLEGLRGDDMKTPDDVKAFDTLGLKLINPFRG